ncbi:MAG: ABC transporter substrate-binding protein [Oscillospiraceae bacterium]|nr:ABC transporter substrate-binding protein [Oscillospiraceae bacterium]
MKKIPALLLALCLAATLLAGCGASSQPAAGDSAAPADSAASAAPAAKKTFVFGDTTFNAENEEPTINPHEAYSGWPCIRYGVGETLMKIADDGSLQPWLAESAVNLDANTWEIVIRDAVCFSNGRKCDAAAVRACLEHLIQVHERAAGNLNIASMAADGQKLTIVTAGPNPILMNYLSEPYGCIIDMDAGIPADGCVVGTGPYVATEVVTDDHVNLIKNVNYWDGEVKIDEITVRTISDGDTLAMALQSGEIDAAYGMAYASYPLFENDSYRFSGIQTSRCFWGMVNLHEENPGYAVMSDPAVREALAMGIDKEGFVNVLLGGHGYPATGAFPDSFPFGQGIRTVSYDPEQAKAVLEAAGWVDTDGDGIREKDGVRLSIRWLTYPSRQELPLLLESSQATLRDIGIEVIPNNTRDHNSVRKDPTAWDVWVSANVNAGLGDPQNFFDTYCLDDSVKNSGGHHTDRLEALAAELRGTFDPAERARLAVDMQQELLDDNSYFFCSFLRMSMIMKANVTGLEAHTCDFYELTADLDIG